MTTTRTSPPPASGPRAGAPAASRGAAPPVLPPRGRRRPGLLALAVALTAAGALAATWLVASAGDRTPVLVLARDVPAGTVVTQADVRVSDVAVDPGVATVPADQAPSVVGMVAAGDLTAGSLLAPGQVTPTAPPGEGEVLIPLAVKATQLPAGGVAAGDDLLVVDTPPADADPATFTPTSLPVRVVRLGPPDASGISVLDVVTAEGNGPAVAVRSASGRFALVLLPAGGER